MFQDELILYSITNFLALFYIFLNYLLLFTADI